MKRRVDPLANSMRLALEAMEKLDYPAALDALEPVVRAKPRHPAANYYLSRAYFFLGEVEKASRHLHRAVRAGAGLPASSFLAVMAAFDPTMNHAAVLACRKEFFAALRREVGMKPRRPKARRRGPRKILRVGYVSSFFHADHWMKPVWALLDHHDPERVETHVFSDSPQPAIARRRARLARARFHDISRLDNARAASLIAARRIDILVDLNGFSKTGRLPLFLARPAPLVVSWFNIFGTTGMPCFDAIIGDRSVIRANEERWYVERVVKLPMSYLTFEVTYPVPKVAPAPGERNGFITFGSLTSLYKWNDQVIRAWAEILRRCPKSRLVLANALLGTESNRRYTLRRLASLGIPIDRLRMSGGAPHAEFLKLYASIDIALDTFPYNGGTTTSEAIWQGVPVLTFRGDRWISRTSATILAHAGLREFVCRNRRAYIEAAVGWGTLRSSAPELARLRATMRRRLKQTPILGSARFARAVEDVYRDLWQNAGHSESA
jgi:protein O-GlcNAc transferase